VREQRLDLAPQSVIALTRTLEKSRTIIFGARKRRVAEIVDASPALSAHRNCA
jgi:hypothetical protein